MLISIANINICKKSALSIKKWFCNSFGALSGSFWELLGGSWELSGVPRSTKEGVQIHFGALLGVVCSPLAAEDGLGEVLGPSMSFFIPSRNLLESILSSQTDPPTLKNDGFMTAGARFLKNHHFRSKDGFGSVLGLSRPHFGSSWGSPKGPGRPNCTGLLFGFKR